MIPEEKLCPRCNEVKPADEFYVVNKKVKPKLQSYCKPCVAWHNNEWRAANPEKAKATRRRSEEKFRKTKPRQNWTRQLKALYGITADDYERMLDEQGGVCAICKCEPGKKRLHVDHDHKTGNVRSLLCSRCNTALGLLDEDPERLQVAIDYLWTHQNQSLDGLRLLNEAIEAIRG